MNQKVMDAMFTGLAGLVSAFFNTAAKKGLAIIILVVVIATLTGLIVIMDRRQQAIAKETAAKFEVFETKLEMCNAERAALAVEVAGLRTRIELITRKH